MAGHVRKKKENKWYYSFEASSVGGGRTKKNKPIPLIWYGLSLLKN